MLGWWVVAGLGLTLLLVSLLVHDVVDGLGVADALGAGEWLSGPVVGAFLCAFGAAGGLAASRGADGGPAALAGLGGGLVLAAPVAWATRALMRAGTDATPSSRDLVGLTGTVVTAVPADGYGEVALRLAGAPLKVNARARPGATVPAGTKVRVVESLSATSVLVQLSD
ncbi:MAG: hypothetical protein U0Q15_18985 [Kineosporiaceae bacterium]